MDAVSSAAPIPAPEGRLRVSNNLRIPPGFGARQSSAAFELGEVRVFRLIIMQRYLILLVSQLAIVVLGTDGSIGNDLASRSIKTTPHTRPASITATRFIVD